MKTPRFNNLLLLLLCATVAAGCGRKPAAPTAPVPQTLSGMTRDRTSYTFLKWDQGLAIMLVDWCDSHSMSSSSGTGGLDQRNGDAHWWDEVSAEWKEGYVWQLATTNGQIAKITINDVQYDLAKGAVFRIGTGDDGATVTQINHDLSNIQPNRNSCDRFITSIRSLRNPVRDYAPNERSMFQPSDSPNDSPATQLTSRMPLEGAVIGNRSTADGRE